MGQGEGSSVPGHWRRGGDGFATSQGRRGEDGGRPRWGAPALHLDPHHFLRGLGSASGEGAWLCNQHAIPRGQESSAGEGGLPESHDDAVPRGDFLSEPFQLPAHASPYMDISPYMEIYPTPGAGRGAWTIISARTNSSSFAAACRERRLRVAAAGRWAGRRRRPSRFRCAAVQPVAWRAVHSARGGREVYDGGKGGGGRIQVRREGASKAASLP